MKFLLSAQNMLVKFLIKMHQIWGLICQSIWMKHVSVECKKPFCHFKREREIMFPPGQTLNSDTHASVILYAKKAFKVTSIKFRYFHASD